MFEKFLKESGLFSDNHLMHEKYRKVWNAAQQSVQRTALAAGLIGCVLGSGFSLAIYTLLFGCR